MIPRLSPGEFAQLEADIQANGVRDPIVTDHDGWILDGHHRFEIAPDAPSRVLPGSKSMTEEEKLAYVIRANVVRRHLSGEQKDALREKQKDLALRLYKQQAGKRWTQAEIGVMLGVSQPLIAAWLAENISSISADNVYIPPPPAEAGEPDVDSPPEAPAPDESEVWDKRRKVKLAEVKQMWQEKKDGWTQAEIADAHKISQPRVSQLLKKYRARLKHEADERKAAKEAAKKKTAPQITKANCPEWLAAMPQCDLLLTDPPYMTDVKNVGEFAESWLPTALDIVKPTGRAYVCIGAYPDELFAYLNIEPPSHLVLANVLVWTYRNTLGPSPSHDYKLNWQAVLYYRGNEAPKLNCLEMVEQFTVQDVVAPDARHGKRWHQWQKPDELAERFVRHGSKPKDKVYDPFCGTGTFLLAAARLGRVGRGCDSSDEMISIAVERGCRDA